MKVLILAGGLGTRLQPLVSDLPKPMAPAGDRPFLEHLVVRLRSQGFLDIIICVGHMAAEIQGYFGDGRRFGVHIAYAVETGLLGTAGAIKNAQDFINDTSFIVMNGDSFLDIQIKDLVDHHRQIRLLDPLVIGTLATIKVDDASSYGTLEINNNGLITHFAEKAARGPGWINAGIYLLEPVILDYIPAGQAVSIERETFPLMLERDPHLHAFPGGGFFVDIGTPEGYDQFQKYVEEHGL